MTDQKTPGTAKAADSKPADQGTAKDQGQQAQGQGAKDSDKVQNESFRQAQERESAKTRLDDEGKADVEQKKQEIDFAEQRAHGQEPNRLGQHPPVNFGAQAMGVATSGPYQGTSPPLAEHMTDNPASRAATGQDIPDTNKDGTPSRTKAAE